MWSSAGFFAPVHRMVQIDARRRQSQRIIGRRRNEHRRRIRRHRNILRRSGPVNRRCKCRPPLRRIAKSHARSHHASRREPDDAHAIRRNSILSRMLPNVDHRRQAIGHSQRHLRLHHFAEFLLVFIEIRKLLRGVFAGVRQPVLQHECRHAPRHQVFRHIVAFAVDRKRHESAARANHDRTAIARPRGWLEHRQRRLGHVRHHLGVPDLREVSLLRIVRRRRPRCRPRIERNYVLRSRHAGKTNHRKQQSKPLFFHSPAVY